MGTKNKKEQFKDKKNNSEKGGDSKGLAVGVIMGIIIAAAVAFVLFGGGPGGGVSTVRAENGVVKIPMSHVNDGQAHYYTYNGSKAIQFFVLRSSDGIIRAAFDACDVCYQAKKGYRQEGDTMVCNNCGQRFPSAKINEIKGGCNPAPLNRFTDGDYLVLKARDIETGAFYF